MSVFSLRVISTLFICFLFIGCANIVPPTGGKKDVTPPKLLAISPEDSLLNTRVTEINLRFDEFLALKDPSKEIQISPLLRLPLVTVLNGKKLQVQIPDSLLKDSTTYRISFGAAVQDLNENNEVKNFNYIFSTGPYFDSLSLHGEVYNAATGKPAESAIILLYDAELSDSAVVREKPEYIANIQANGGFKIPGLPAKAFKIYALKDANENLIYDGEEEEIAFIDSVVVPVDTLITPITFRLFKEIPPADSLDDDDTTKKKDMPAKGRFRKKREEVDADILKYSVGVDTADTARRTHDLNKPVKLTFSLPIDTYDVSRVFLSTDSSDIEIEVPFEIERDTSNNIFFVKADWKPNGLYTIRILKDFATDTAEHTSLPSKHIFRTLSEDDYGVLGVNTTNKYYGEKYLLQVITESDTVYNEQLTDSSVVIKRLLPATYNIYIIEDANLNGKWDTGDLFAKRQPEYVYPYNTPIELKAGWENVIDFVQPVSEPKLGKDKTNNNRKGDRKGAK